jgi:copper chaperone CopZ
MVLLAKESIYFTIPDMDKGHDPKKLKEQIDKLHGIISVSVSSDTGKVAVDYDSTGTDGNEIKRQIEKLGFSPKMTRHDEHIM